MRMDQKVSVAFALFVVTTLGGCAHTGAETSRRKSVVIFPPPPAQARIVYLGAINAGTFLGEASSRMAGFLFRGDSVRTTRIVKPFGIAVHDESLFVCDTQMDIVHVFDFKKNRVDALGKHGRGRLLEPVAVAIGPQGRRYVADAQRGEVVVFSTENEAVAVFGGVDEGEFKPVAVAVHGRRLYIADAATHRIEVRDALSGKRLAVFGGRGQSPGQLLHPTGLAVDAAGRVYVSDQLNCRIQVFEANGKFIRAFGQAGDRAGHFARPKHLAVGSDGILFVVDAGFQRVQMFDEQDRVLMLFGGPGTDPGSMTLPAGICVDKTLLAHFADRIPMGFKVEYLVLVSDQFGPRKVSVYAFGQGAPTGADDLGAG